MRCLLRLIFGVFAIVGVLVVLGVAALVISGGKTNTSPGRANSQPAQSSGALTIDYTGPAPRSGKYAGFNVTFVNTTDGDITNPFTDVVVSVAGREWPCQGYIDPYTGKPIAGVVDALMEALTLRAQTRTSVTVLCQIPNMPMGDARVRLR